MLKDVFSFDNQSIQYDIARPTYPDELINKILQYCTNKDCVLDVATGTGILLFPLSKHFNKSIGIDISETQISIPKEKYKDYHNLEFKIGDAHKLEEVKKDTKYDAICVAQGFHWFDDKLFFESAKKVLKENGIIALAGYNMLRILNNKEFETLVNDWYSLIKPHFEFDRTILENEYQSYTFPYDLIKKFNFVKKQEVKLSKVITYLESFSAYRCYLKNNKSNEDPIVIIKNYMDKSGDIDVSTETDFFLFILSNDKSLNIIDNM